jgi:hypothetical protein
LALAAALGGVSSGDPYVAPGKFRFLRCPDIAALSLLGVLAPAMVQPMEHVDAVGLGLGVTELGGKAADETRPLGMDQAEDQHQ